MANYTALVDVKVDVGRANKAFKNIEGSLLRVSKATKGTNKFLGQMEKTFGGIQKSMLISAQAGRSTVRQLKQLSGAAKTSAADVEKLKKQVKTLQTELDKLNGKAGKVMPIFRKLGKMYKEHSFLIQSMTSAFFGFIQYQLIGGLRRMTDQFVLMSNRVRVVNQDMKVFNTNMQNAFKIAQETRQPLFTVANTLARIGRNSAKLRTDFTRLARITSTIGKSFQIAGATIEEANNAMIQLSQAFASGRLQGDELRSVLELAPRLAQAISSSIGITVGQMRQFAKEGKLTTRVLEQALVEASANVDKEFKTIQKTIGQSLTLVNNSLTMVVGSIDKITGTNRAFADAFTRISKAIDKLGRSRGALQVANFLKGIADNLEAILLVGGSLLATGVLAGLGVGFAAIALSLGKVSLVITAVSAAIVGLTFAFTDFGSTAKPVFEDVVGSNKEQLDQLKGQVAQASDYIKEQTEKLAFAKSVKADQGFYARVFQFFLGPEKGTQKDLSKNIKEAGNLLEKLTKRVLELERLITKEKKDQEGLARKLFLAESQRMAVQKQGIESRFRTGMSGVTSMQRDPVQSLRTSSIAIEKELVKSEKEIGTAVAKIFEAQIQATANLPGRQQLISKDGSVNIQAILANNRELIQRKQLEGVAGPAAPSLIGESLKETLAPLETKLKTAIEGIITALIQSRNSLIQSLRDSNRRMTGSLTNFGVVRGGLQMGLSRTAGTGVSGNEARQFDLKKRIKFEQELQRELYERTIDLDKLSGKELKTHNRAMAQLEDLILKNEALKEAVKARKMLEAAEAQGRSLSIDTAAQQQLSGRYSASQSPGMMALSGGNTGVAGSQKSAFERYNNAVIQSAKKYGIELKSIGSQIEKNTSLGFTQLTIDEERTGLTGERLEAFKQELGNAQKMLDATIQMTDAEKKQAMTDTAVGGTMAAGGEHGQRAAKATAAYYSGGGGLTGLINALVELVLGNKKVMEALFKILGDFMEVIDEAFTPIGELLLDVMGGLKPLMSILKQIMRPFGKMFLTLMKVMEPITGFIEQLQPIFFMLEAVMMGLLALVDFIMQLVGQTIEGILSGLGIAQKDEGYKSAALLSSEERILSDIEKTIEKTAEHLEKINDVIFDIEQSTLNLAAPAVKLEDSAAKYDELFEAATRTDATEEAVDAYTAYAKEFLQQSQDIFKSSAAYQDIYDTVLADLNTLNTNYVEEASDTLTGAFQKAIFDLDLVGSDLGAVFTNIVDDFNAGIITLADAQTFLTSKQEQIAHDLSLYDYAEQTDVSVKNIGDMEKLYNMRMNQHNQTQGRATSSMEGKIGVQVAGGPNLRGYETELAAGSAGVDSGIYNRVLQAALLIMNPEHYAVSVRRNSDGSLEVLDRATDAGALSMMAAANAAGVPVVVDPATARALYAGDTSGLSNLNIGSSPTTVGTSSGKLQIGSVERVTFDREESSNPLDDLLGRLPDLGGSLAGLAQAILDGFMEALKSLGAGIQDILNAVFGFIGDAFAGVGDVATQVLSAIMSPIMDAMSSAGNIVSQFFAGIFEPISQLIVNVPDFLAGLFYPISGVFVNVMDFLRGIFKPIFDMGAINITAFFQQLFDLIFSGNSLSLSSIGQQILGAAVDFTGAAKDAISTIWEKVKEAIGGFFDFDNSFNAVSDLITRAGTAIADFFNIDVPSGGIKLLKNPFYSYNIGPEYFINWSWEKGGLLPEQFANGGNTKAGTAIHSSMMGSSGGMAVGKSHLSGGMPGVIKTTGQPIEFEGGEYIINKKSVNLLGSGALDAINSIKTPSQASRVKTNYGAFGQNPKLVSSTDRRFDPFVGLSQPPGFQNGGSTNLGLKNIDGEGFAAARAKYDGAKDGDTPGFPKTLFNASFTTKDWPWPFSQIGDHGIEAKFSMKNAADIGDSYFRTFADGGSLNFEQKLKHETTESAINSLYYGKRLGAKATASKKGERSDFYDGRPDLPLIPFIGKGSEVAGESCTTVDDPTNCRKWGKACTTHGCWKGRFPNVYWGQCESCATDYTNCEEWGKIESCTPILRNYYHDVELWGEKLLPNNSSAKGMENAQETITGAFQLVLAAATGMHPYWPGAKSTKGYYAKGGMIHGAPHSKGGVPIYAEGGEFVVNKNATRRHRGLLSRINSFQEGGSTSFNPSDYFGIRTTENTGDAGFLSEVYSGGTSEQTVGALSMTAGNTSVANQLLQQIADTQIVQYEALTALIMGMEFSNTLSVEGNAAMVSLLEGVKDHISSQHQSTRAQGEFIRQNLHNKVGGSTDKILQHNPNSIKSTRTALESHGSSLFGLMKAHVTASAPDVSGIASTVGSNNALLYDIKETVDHMRKKADRGSGLTNIFGGSGTVLGGITNTVSNIFSDRGVKTFRGGGMTESQQTDMLRKVQPQTFRYKSGGPVQTGFMAQDLQRSSFGRQFVHDSPVGKYVDGGIIGPLLASQSIMQSRMDSYQMGGQIASDSGMSEALLQGIIDAIRDQDMNVNVYTNTEDEVGQMMNSSNTASAEAGYRDVVNYA